MEAHQASELSRPNEDNSHLLNNKTGSDVSFIVDSERFHAHKSILCESSKYFRNLLNSSFQPTGHDMELEVEMRDISPVIFYKVLQYIYAGRVPDQLEELDDNTLLGLLGASVFYQLAGLQQGIEHFLADHRVTVANVTPLWRLALETGAHILAQKCADMFRECSDKIAQLPDLQEQMWEPLELASFLEDPVPVSPIKAPDEILIQSFLDQSTDGSSISNSNQSNAPKRNLLLGESFQDDSAFSQNSQNYPYQHINAGPQGKMIPPQPYPFYPPYQNNSQSSQPPSQTSQANPKSKAPSQASQNNSQGSQLNYINIYPQNIGNDGKTGNKNSASRPPPPSYKTLAAKQKRLPMLQGPIWEKALEKMGTVIDLLREVTQADFATLFLHDPITNELISHVTHPEVVDIALPADLGIAGSCFQNREIINSPAAYTDARFYSGIDRRTGAPTLAILAVPIFDSELTRTLGVIELLNKKRTTSFTADNEGEVQMVSRMISKIVDKASNDVRSDVDKKGIKRIHLYNNDETGRRARRNPPVLHFKQMKEPSQQ